MKGFLFLRHGVLKKYKPTFSKPHIENKKAIIHVICYTNESFAHH